MRGAVAFDEEGATLVNCANGVLWISEDDISLGSHREDLNFSVCLQATWDEAEAPEFFRVLMEALPETDDLALLQWFAGYLLFPDRKQHEVFLICHGPGGICLCSLAAESHNPVANRVVGRRRNPDQRTARSYLLVY